ncbi:uncharacterized protein THITE_2118098 [Thermothielavioides terrestris NRRL 8126]|uniref:Only prolin and serin are matching in the corresponding protein n=1 Tax=Thermothielavioides terrestris (strain ATCC 38088 / NRRL 8126) TaxID=578455 RepID=G2R6X1_THETT|nr:uncharacterized protein THITE_2118098 [Thermothielavioides terrestris NRRL 8126]AEO68549.1 hypothetical protein THITE_2118098 [Thermothielavioides terrestris NRRL 8126]
MSTGLKPLLLPRLVEERKKLESHHDNNEGDAASLYYIYDSSSSDLASPSPITSTFSRTNHSRLSGSSSSLELGTPPCTDTPASPAHSLHAIRPGKAQLPDVQEEPLEREEEEPATPPKDNDREFSFHDYCLCDVPCSHHGDSAQSTSIYRSMTSDYDYDLGFLSDGDFDAGSRQRKRRHGSDAGFSSWSTRLGSRLPSLPRWRSASAPRRHDLTFSPASDPSLADPRPSFSRNRSSRSSSVSGYVHGSTDPAHDSVPATPALSFYESSESVVSPSPLDNMPATLGRRVEQDRALATTPLLPPLLTEALATQPHSLQPSPLQSPTMVQSPGFAELGSVKGLHSPPLSAQPSVSSLRRGTISSAFGDAPSPIPCLFDHQDSWSDRLGHANFTIEPRPYVPESADLATLQAFRADWNLARTNYAKHLVRTAEHYGATSKTYGLTEAKWAEIEQEWQRAEDDLVARLGHQCNGDPSIVSQLLRSAEEKLSPSIPRMLSDDGKFPELGDVEIVGPMVREAAMVRDGQEDRRNSASGWLKSLAGKVGLRK